MDMSGQLHTPAALYPRKEFLEAECAPGHFWML
jgi:hypothetical protein